MSACWSLRARRRDGFVHLRLELLDPFGELYEWVDVPPVRLDEPREALLAARIVHSASRGAVSHGSVMRLIRLRCAA